MKQNTSFLTRCFALFLALLMVVSGSNLGVALQVSAAGSDVEVNVGKLVADNYELTDAEKALLSSGNLAGETISYTAPTNEDGLVAVDTENKTITAKDYKGWIPTIARIKVGTEVIESIALDGGKGKYTYAENAFSVEVDYIYDVAVAVEKQETLLNTAAWLKNGVANLNAVSGQAGNLYILEQAMPALVEFATAGIAVPGMGSAGLSPEGKAAVFALNDQFSANGGRFNLSLMVEEYDSGSRSEYLLKHGTEIKAELDAFVGYIAPIRTALKTLSDNLSWIIAGGYIDETTANNLKTLSGVTTNLENALSPLSLAEWVAAEKGLALVSDAVNFAALDALVAALGALTPMPTIRESLHVADTTLTVNMSMVDVTVVIELKVVEDKADSAVLVVYDTKTTVLTVAEGITELELLAEVEAKGLEDAAEAAWGDVYVEEHYYAVGTDLPDVLTADCTYTVTYAPAEYAVSYGYETDTPTAVPYGYQLTLPVHENENKAYDYVVNDESYAQGTVVTIKGDTNVTRTSGKAYVGYDLYKIVSENYGNTAAQNILKSGALHGNVAVSVREPDPLVDTALVTLLDGVVTAKNYNAAYMGLNWVPSTYGLEGTENVFSGNTASWAEKSVKVQYQLVLSNFSVEKSAEILKLAADLKAEADAQKATLDKLAAYHSTMAQLDKTKLGALNGVIDVTDFTPGDGTDTDAANLEMRAYFKSMVGGIIANNLGSNNLLNIYNILSLYLDENSGGLRYYYANSAEVINEINVLSGYLTGLLADDEKVAALEIMVGAAGYPEYAEKIMDLERIMSEVKAALTAPNAMIDLTSSNLGKLIDALEAEGEVAVVGEVNHPYLTSKAMTGMDASQVNVQVAVWLGEDRQTFTSASFDRGYVLTAEDVADLQNKLNAAVTTLMGENARFYTLTVEDTPIDQLVGVELDKQLSITYTYTAKNFTVKIAGEADQIINIDNLEISLPKHTEKGWEYRYTIDGVSGITSTSYTFKPAQLDSLFAEGVYEITRVAVDTVAENLGNAFKDWAVEDENGSIVALNAKIDANKNGIMEFVDVLLNANYSYIGLNGEDLLYLNEENTLEVSLQTLINAILKDNTFGSETLIALGKNGNGKFIAAEMQLGNSKEEATTIPFTLTLKTVPAQMGTVAKGLDAVKNYVSFKSNDGVLTVKLNLPEKIYEVYLTALLATGNVEKDDITAVNTEIAFMFLYDYLDIITKTDATTQSYTNTLAKLNINKSLTGYEDYYQMLKKALTADGLVVNSEEGDGIFDISVTAAGKPAIDKLIALAGVDMGSMGDYINMLKEYKPGNKISVTVIPSLSNAGTAFEAVVIDVKAVKGDVENAFDYTTDLVARAKSITGQAAIMLLGNVDGDLTFNSTTILDLNGYTINGNVVSNGSLYIVDSTRGTANCGGISGTVSGNVKIVAGNYNANVAAYLPEGYKQVGTSVQNALFTVESDGNNFTYVINSDVIDEDGFDVKYLAVEIALDVALNYFTAASLSVDGNELYNINIYDLIDLIDSANKVDELINRGLNSVNVPGFSDFVNMILADLIDFAAIEYAIANDEALATYTLTTAPWTVAVDHVPAATSRSIDSDYITFGITSNPELAKDITVSIKLGGDNKAYAQKLAGALADIVVKDGTFITIDLLQPVYADKTVSASGSAKAAAEIDLTVDKNYTTIVAVVMAYGNPEQAADLVKYLNAGNMGKLKETFDKMTVEDVFDALKACNRATSFTAMANKVGVTINVAEAAELENIYHLILVGAGKALEVLEITGRDSKLGGLDKDNDGTYEFSATTKKSGSVSARGYAVEANVTEVSVSLTVHLFGNNCIVGDVNHDDKINTGDIVELRKILSIVDYDIICEYCADVDQNGVINTGDLVALRKMLTTAP